MSKHYRVVAFFSLVTYLLVTCASAQDCYSNRTYVCTDPEWTIPNPRSLLPRPYKIAGIQWTQDYNCTQKQYIGHSFNLANPPRCGTPNGKDYYGFGVRIGFYSTWFASFVANNFAPEEIAGATDANTIFLFALAVSILRGTILDEFQRVDALIMNLIATGTTVGTMSLWGYRSCRYRLEGRSALRFYGGSGTYARAILCILTNIYWCWFWQNPLRRGLEVATCDPRCGAAWVFGHTVTSGIRWLFFAFGVLFMIYWTPAVGGIFVTLCRRFMTLRELRGQKAYRETSKVTLKTGLSDKQLKTMSLIFAVLNLLWLVFVIALVEKTLHQNNAPGSWVTSPENASPSQLIPLLIGATTLYRMIYVAHQTRRYVGQAIEPTLPEPASNVRREPSGVTKLSQRGEGTLFDKLTERVRMLYRPLLKFSPGYTVASSSDWEMHQPRSDSDNENCTDSNTGDDKADGQDIDELPFRGSNWFIGIRNTWMPWFENGNPEQENLAKTKGDTTTTPKGAE